MDHNNRLLELPTDVVREIWSYLSLPDVVRFGMTGKNMMDKIWPFYQQIETTSISAFSFVLSRDLTHARELCCTAIQHEFKELADDIKQIITSIATKKAPNLIALVTDVDFMTDCVEELTYFNKFIQSQTQLQQLHWYNAQLERGSDLDIGQFLSGHTRLTELSVQTSKTLHGMNLLTQLKNLSLSLCDSLDSALFSDVAMNLTQLNSLEFIFPHSIDEKAFANITNLTNLELLSMRQTSEIKSSSLTALLKLPKLTNFRLNVRYQGNMHRIDEYSLPITIIAQLTNLTTLEIDYDNLGDLNLGQLTTLTNLNHMKIENCIKIVDLSSFRHLTSLAIIRPKEFKKIQSLPPNLKKLTIAYSLNLSESDIEIICSLNNLEDLQLRELDFTSKVLAQQITRLTNLNSLIVLPFASKDLIPALEKLPNLANLRFRRVPNEIVDNLAKLTQLMTLTYVWNDKVKDLQQKLPFKVVYYT